MFTKNQSAEERLSTWRDIRQTNFDNVDDLLNEFSNITLQQRYIDYYTPSNWPSVFEIVSEGMTCQSGVTLVLAATLYHKGFITNENLEFSVISNHINGIEGLVLVSDNLVYNFLPGVAVSKEEVDKNSTTYFTHNVPVSQLFN